MAQDSGIYSVEIWLYDVQYLVRSFTWNKKVQVQIEEKGLQEVSLPYYKDLGSLWHVTCGMIYVIAAMATTEERRLPNTVQKAIDKCN